MTTITPPSRPASRTLALCLCSAFVLASVALMPSALAKGSKSPEKVFSGEIVLSQKRFPYRFKSDKHMISFMKKADTKTFTAKDGKWSFEYMVFAKKPVNTLQASMAYYDITDGKKRRINEFTIYPHDQSDKIINGHADLDEEMGFQPNRKYLVVFSRGYGSEALAQSQFVLYAEPGTKAPEEKGEVNF